MFYIEFQNGPFDGKVINVPDDSIVIGLQNEKTDTLFRYDPNITGTVLIRINDEKEWEVCSQGEQTIVVGKNIIFDNRKDKNLTQAEIDEILKKLEAGIKISEKFYIFTKFNLLIKFGSSDLFISLQNNNNIEENNFLIHQNIPPEIQQILDDALKLTNQNYYVGLPHLVLSLWHRFPELWNLREKYINTIAKLQNALLKEEFTPTWDGYINTPRLQSVLSAISQKEKISIEDLIGIINEKNVSSLIKESLPSKTIELTVSKNNNNNIEKPAVLLTEENEERYIARRPFNTINEQKNKSSKYPIPILDKFGFDLTQKLKERPELPVRGREEEINKMITILNSPICHNVLFVGEAGVGKTAMAIALAQRINAKNVPEQLKDKRIIVISPGAISADTKYVGELEKKILDIVEEVEKNENIILFIDEIHILTGGHRSIDDTKSAAQLFKPALSDGKLCVIGATTPEEFTKFIQPDPAFLRRFQVVNLKKLTKQETYLLLEDLIPSIKKYYGIELSKQAIFNIVELADMYLPAQNFPSKAFTIIENIASEISLKKSDFYMNIDEIKNIIAHIANIPPYYLSTEPRKKLVDIETFLKTHITGQDAAIQKLAQTLRLRAKTHLSSPQPWGAFLLVGPSGCGKTSLALALAEFLYETKDKLLRFDMSEYNDENSVWTLIGSPPGYSQSIKGGRLTNLVAQYPDSIVLFDEIEKAHKDVHQLLLQVMDAGRLTDNQGHTVSFKHNIILMTSNIGAELFTEQPIGFIQNTSDIPKYERIMEYLHRFFSYEFLNRVAVLPFKALSNNDIQKIVCKKIEYIKETLNKEGKEFIFDCDVIKKLAELGHSPKYGIRHLDRVIDEYILAPIYGNKWYQADWEEINTINCLLNSANSIVLEYNLLNVLQECYDTPVQAVHVA